MSVNKELIEIVTIPGNLRKQTTLASAMFYEKVDIFGNRVSGYKNGQVAQTWYYKDYISSSTGFIQLPQISLSASVLSTSTMVYPFSSQLVHGPIL